MEKRAGGERYYPLNLEFVLGTELSGNLIVSGERRPASPHSQVMVWAAFG